MKKVLNLILAFVFVVGICASAPVTIKANAASVDDLTFELNVNGTMYKVEDCKENASGKLVIPSTYNGLPVTLIGSEAFKGCRYLTSITIPDSVTSIGDYTFDDCDSLTSVTIGNGVTSIGEDAFHYCSSLTSVYITDIASWCNIDFERNLLDYTSNPLRYAENLYLNGELVTELVIPEGVTEIKKDAFYNCDSLTSITIPDSVTSIGFGAFDGCTSLTNVTIPDSVTSIGFGAFDGCTSLTSVYIPDSITNIGDSAFEDCISLTSITIPKGVTSIGYEAFYNCSSLTSVTIPDGVTSIGSFAFCDCESLSSIIIPDSVTIIGNDAFYGCSSLTSITIPDSVTSINDGTFNGCTSLTSVTIPDSVTRIGEYYYGGAYYDYDRCFYNCPSLTSVTIPASVIYIRSKSFGYVYDSWEEQESKVEGFTIYGVCGTEAYEYAKVNGFKFIPTDHRYSSEVTKQPTCTETGLKTFTCSCGDSYTETISALGHNYATDFTIDKNPTYDEAGSKSRHCTRCDAKTDVTSIPKLVRLSAPTIASITSEQNGVKITWNAVNGAEEYVVFKLIDGVYKDISVVGASTLSFTDQTAVDGETYCYAVASRDSMGNVSQYSEFAHTYKKITSLATPTVKVANASNGVKVTWNAIENAESYKVYRKTYNAKTKKWGSWKSCGTVTTTSYVDKSAKSGTKYKYTVKALNGDVKSDIKSSSTILFLGQPTVKIANASTGVKVTWNKITGATGYKVYRAEYANGKWSGWKSVKTIDKGSTTSWTDKKVTSGVKYKYAVKAVNGKTTSTYKSSSSLLYLAQPTVTVKAVSNGVKVNWTQSSGATSYTVYRSEYNAKTKKWSSWKSIKTAKSTSKSYTDKSAKKGVKYRYTVKAVNGKVASTYKASGSVKR